MKKFCLFAVTMLCTMLMSTFVFADEIFLDNDEGVILFEDEESVSILEDVDYFVDGVDYFENDDDDMVIGVEEDEDFSGADDMNTLSDNEDVLLLLDDETGNDNDTLVVSNESVDVNLLSLAKFEIGTVVNSLYDKVEQWVTDLSNN